MFGHKNSLPLSTLQPFFTETKIKVEIYHEPKCPHYKHIFQMNGETVTETERAFRHLIDLFYWPIRTFCYKHAHCCYHTSPQYSAYFAYLNTK